MFVDYLTISLSGIMDIMYLTLYILLHFLSFFDNYEE